MHGIIPTIWDLRHDVSRTENDADAPVPLSTIADHGDEWEFEVDGSCGPRTLDPFSYMPHLRYLLHSFICLSKRMGADEKANVFSTFDWLDRQDP